MGKKTRTQAGEDVIFAVGEQSLLDGRRCESPAVVTSDEALEFARPPSRVREAERQR